MPPSPELEALLTRPWPYYLAFPCADAELWQTSDLHSMETPVFRGSREAAEAFARAMNIEAAKTRARAYERHGQRLIARMSEGLTDAEYR